MNLKHFLCGISEMTSQFTEQVQILMQTQQIKCTENVFGKSNYMWLCSKKTPIIWISVRNEFLIRQALNKVTIDQQTQVMKQLLAWLHDHPNAHYLKIPEICLILLNSMATSNAISEMNFSRMASFRNSFRHLSHFSNKIAPVDDFKARNRSVTFNDEPVIYRITN